MSPRLPDLLLGLAVAMGVPAPPEAGGDYAVSRLGLIATLLVLASQEAEHGPAARLWENEAIAALLSEARDSYRAVLAGRLDVGDAQAETSWSALDARNAQLLRGLIALHESAEDRRDEDMQRRILALYEAMAHARRLDLPSS